MKRVMFFLFLSLLVVGSLAAQSAAADAQRVVGTWTQDGVTWVFNANGTGTRGNQNFVFGVSTEGRIDIIGLGDTWRDRRFFIAPNGSRMIILSSIFIRN